MQTLLTGVLAEILIRLLSKRRKSRLLHSSPVDTPTSRNPHTSSV